MGEITSWSQVLKTCRHGVKEGIDYHKDCPACRQLCIERGHDLTDDNHRDGNACMWLPVEDIRHWIEETRKHFEENRNEWRKEMEPRYLSTVALMKKCLKRWVFLKRFNLFFLWLFTFIYFFNGIMFLIGHQPLTFLSGFIDLLLLLSYTSGYERALKEIAEAEEAFAEINRTWDQSFDDIFEEILKDMVQEVCLNSPSIH